ncbi:MAG: TssQ family T6SS-associated lipoprotein, partial [Gammaproteobacteria bacterium]|nr:TssQ family T6SS-associated lipoprotein [Gammaproteobacteria bacterium]
GSGGIRLFGDSVAKRYLAKGVSEYETGNYVNAKTALQGVLENQYATRHETLWANKYLAFIYCVSGDQKLCRTHFRNVLEINPNFDLSDAEAGHPLWGPVFRSVKGAASK